MYIHKRKKNGKKVNWETDVTEEVAYWRKANQIHRWFVINVQDGNDNCKDYLVNKPELEELLRRCKYILDNVKTKNGKVSNGYTYEKDENGNLVKKHNYVEGKIITNPELCEDILPTQEGFFFGSTEYDEYYLEDIKNTVEQLETILDTIDFDEYELYYGSSW